MTVTVITKYFYWDIPSSLHVVITLIMVAREVITALIVGVICDDHDCDDKIFLLGHIFITGVINLITLARDIIMAKE